MDPLLRHTAIRAAQSATGAKVDINAFMTGIFPPKLSVREVALASATSPGTNLAEFDELNCRISRNPLLRKCLVIEEARVTGLRFGTVRNADGQLEIQSEPGNQQPSWIAERLRNIGDAWLEDLVLDVRQELDPNALETLRTGRILSVKWEQRLDSLREELGAFKSRVEILQNQMDSVKQLRPVAQTQQYLQLAKEGETLLRDARRLQNEIQTIVPEAGADLSLLDVARQNDQRELVQRIRQLKVSPRGITESLIGPELYRHLHQALTWLQLGSKYQKQIRRQMRVVRHRGVDLEFQLLNPTPQFECRRAEFSGELTIDQQLKPFQAVLSNLSSNPRLSGQPTEFRLDTQGEKPLRMMVRHDATKKIPQTDVAAGFHQSQPRILSVGRKETVALDAALANLRWSVRIQLTGSDIDGRISLVSDLHSAELTSKNMTPVIREAVSDVFADIHTVDATVRFNGPVNAPAIEIASGFGETLATGLQSVFEIQVKQLKTDAVRQVAELAAEQKQRLAKDLGGSYRQLVADHKATLEKVQETQQLLSGQMKPQDVIRQVSKSGILGKKTGARVRGQLDQSQKLLQGLGGKVFR